METHHVKICLGGGWYVPLYGHLPATGMLGAAIPEVNKKLLTLFLKRASKSVCWCVRIATVN